MRRPRRLILSTFALLSTAVSTGEAAEPRYCDHIQVLSKAQADEVVADDYAGSAQSPGPVQRLVVRDAGGYMSPFVCDAVRRIAFFEQSLDKNAGLAGRTDRRTPDLLQMSAAPSPGLANELMLRPPDDLVGDAARVPQDIRRHRLARDSARLASAITTQAILHEATHAADYLIQRETVDSGVGRLTAWPDSAKSSAQEVIARNLLRMGVRSEWLRIHTVFVNQGWARPHHEQGMRSGWSDVDLVHAGFTSGYGGHNVADDIAETAAWAAVSQNYSALLANAEAEREALETNDDADERQPHPRKDLACQAMQAAEGPDIPSQLASVFTKVGFLQSLGFITDEAYRNCVGRLHIRAPSPGFHSYSDGALQRSYTGSVERSLDRIEANGPFMLQLSAEGTVTTTSEGIVPAVVTLLLDLTPLLPVTGEAALQQAHRHMTVDNVSYPRGLYKIGYRTSKYNRLLINRKDDGRLIVDVSQGLALVSRANRDLIEGSIVIQRRFNYSGGLMSAIAGDEPMKVPTLMTFRFGNP